MEFEEVRNLIELGHVQAASLSTTSLQWRHPALVQPFINSFPRQQQPPAPPPPPLRRRGRGRQQHYHYQQQQQQRQRQLSTPAATATPAVNSKRPNPILGVSRLMNSVRRLKRKDSSGISNSTTTAEVYRRAAQLSPEYTAYTEVSELTDAASHRPRIKRNTKKNMWSSSSSSAAPSTPEVSCDLHEIKSQMQNFVVPTDWYPTGSQAPCFDHESIASINAQKLVGHLKEGISRFEYLIHLEEQKIESNKAEITEYMEKLKYLDAQTERVNAAVTFGRLDGVINLKSMLKETDDRVPQLQVLREQHERITTSIEGFSKSMSMADRLEILQAQARTTTRTEAVWARVRHWGPFITIVTLSMIFVLLATLR